MGSLVSCMSRRRTLLQNCAALWYRSSQCPSSFVSGTGAAMLLAPVGFGVLAPASDEHDGDKVAHSDVVAGTLAAAPERPVLPPSPPACVTLSLAAAPHWPAPPQAPPPGVTRSLAAPAWPAPPPGPVAGRTPQGAQQRLQMQAGVLPTLNYPLVTSSLARWLLIDDHHEFIFHADKNDVVLQFALNMMQHVKEHTNAAHDVGEDELSHPAVASFCGHRTGETVWFRRSYARLPDGSTVSAVGTGSNAKMRRRTAALAVAVTLLVVTRTTDHGCTDDVAAAVITDLVTQASEQYVAQSKHRSFFRQRGRQPSDSGPQTVGCPPDEQPAPPYPAPSTSETAPGSAASPWTVMKLYCGSPVPYCRLCLTWVTDCSHLTSKGHIKKRSFAEQPDLMATVPAWAVSRWTVMKLWNEGPWPACNLCNSWMTQFHLTSKSHIDNLTKAAETSEPQPDGGALPPPQQIDGAPGPQPLTQVVQLQLTAPEPPRREDVLSYQHDVALQQPVPADSQLYEC